ncbi:cobalamin biosynthesis protein [Agrobacterium sp. a22-2]|uniref:adenosylcobinamide-phosphate synthase CbiB n=1 Tax=Agrobacterium sp. a22-2 TaxID=2283840 RepID=UPI00144733B9|nr:adenosylcobinamide-phosphate synthase CbiB [Agrobacterium sp. a22-2]NKN37845.1 cobalamin biosynthesis protein [Agrobacterium sp. a22-2]
MMQLLTLLLALLLDRLVGDPPWLWKRLPHPVVLFGAAISACDRGLNRAHWSPRRRRFGGVLAIVILLAVSLLLGTVLHRLLGPLGLFGFVLESVIAAIFLAQKSLTDHVSAVAAGLRDGGIAGGRKAVSLIVGRDPETLDEPGVCRAAIESLAENFADGVVAPALWYALLGLPGILAYKMLNTADSMIGHKSDKYRDFGWASARLDDLANWPAARLSALLIAAGALWSDGRRAGGHSLSVALRDHGLHRSPNSGWPEAAMAGALDIGLAGPRVYAGQRVSEPMMNGAGRRNLGAADIDAAVRVLQAAWLALWLVVLLAVVVSL